MVLPHTNERDIPEVWRRLLGWRISRGDPMPGAFISVAMRRGLNVSILRWYDWFMTVGCVSANALERLAPDGSSPLCRHTRAHSTMTPVQHATSVLTASPRRPLPGAEWVQDRTKEARRRFIGIVKRQQPPVLPQLKGRRLGAPNAKARWDRR